MKYTQYTIESEGLIFEVELAFEESEDDAKGITEFFCDFSLMNSYIISVVDTEMDKLFRDDDITDTHYMIFTKYSESVDMCDLYYD